MSPSLPNPIVPMRILMLGATGTIGRATLSKLLAQGHEVVALVRPTANPGADAAGPNASPALSWRACRLSDPQSVAQDGLRGESFDAVVSCLASRTGTPTDAWAIDHQAHLNVLQAAQAAGIRQFVLLSAICVQKPQLAFQMAKLAFEKALIESGLNYSIVRPTAFFKSLSGQIDRVRRGRPFVVFGNGQLTACQPISDEDLAQYLVDCLSDPTRRDRILPIGGPGPAITPLDQAKLLSQALGREVRVRHVPVGLMGVIVGLLDGLSLLWPRLRTKAELARIGRYYATESMLWLDPQTGLYDAASTPSYGTQTLLDHYTRVIQQGERVDLKEHAVF